jgi:predicted lipid-binding transport protein (Tim44 family)
MKGLLAFMSNLMLFLTLATLVTAVATFFAHKLKQRPKPQAEGMSERAKRDAPSLVQAYDPKQGKTTASKG